MVLAAFLDRLVERIERAQVLDGPADLAAETVKKLVSGSVPANLLSGTPLGHPAHPLLVAVPLGAWTSAVVFDVTGDEDAATTLTGVGVLAALPAVFTGLSDWCYTSGGERRVGFVHALVNDLAIVTYAASWLARRRGHHGLGLGLSAVGGVALTAGGWLGGHLAYALGVGVDTTAFQHSDDDWTPVEVDLDSVRVGELSAATAAGVALVLTRDGSGAVRALSDRCTHRGAPLHDGELKDGCVVCPWHDSEFDLLGRVVRGPAVRPQPAYETRITDGVLSVRRPDEQRTLRLIHHAPHPPHAPQVSHVTWETGTYLALQHVVSAWFPRNVGNRRRVGRVGLPGRKPGTETWSGTETGGGWGGTETGGGWGRDRARRRLGGIGG